MHMRRPILSPLRRTSHQISPFVKRIPSIHSTISAWSALRALSLSTTPTLSCQGPRGSISPSTRPIRSASAPKAWIPHGGSRWKLTSPSHGRCHGTRIVPWSGRGRRASEKLRRVRSSASSTRCASSWRCRMTTGTRAGSPRPPRISLSRFPSVSYVSVARHAPAPRVHIPQCLRLMLLPSPRQCRLHSLTTCLSSLHTRNYSTLMEM
jgi:hypothetical protein